jgi:hypothetical protein
VPGVHVFADERPGLVRLVVVWGCQVCTWGLDWGPTTTGGGLQKCYLWGETGSQQSTYTDALLDRGPALRWRLKKVHSCSCHVYPLPRPIFQIPSLENHFVRTKASLARFAQSCDSDSFARSKCRTFLVGDPAFVIIKKGRSDCGVHLSPSNQRPSKSTFSKGQRNWGSNHLVQHSVSLCHRSDQQPPP